MAGQHTVENLRPTEDHNSGGAPVHLAKMQDEILEARATTTGGSPGRACQLAMQQYLDTSPDIFNVKSGPFKGLQVPESLRCGIFQSNIAEKAGLISPREVTVRALEFGALMHSKGYREQNFDPKANYPDGTYIVGNNALDGTNSRHVGMVCGGRLIHTHEGRVLNQAIGEKFYPGAYRSIKVYIPPSGHRTAALGPEITNHGNA